MAGKIVFILIAVLAAQVPAAIIKANPRNLQQLSELVEKLNKIILEKYPPTESNLQEINNKNYELTNSMDVDNVLEELQELLNSYVGDSPNLRKCLKENEPYFQKYAEYVNQASMDCVGNVNVEKTYVEEQFKDMKKEVRRLQDRIYYDTIQCPNLAGGDREKTEMCYDLVANGEMSYVLDVETSAEYILNLTKQMLPHLDTCMQSVRQRKRNSENDFIRDMQMCVTSMSA